jgi:catechol 2,3-dioxygenase-like lactoylglutathione lyase family enzyme
MDNVNILIFPMGYAHKGFGDLWKGRTSFESTKGRVVDHIAFSVDDRAAALARLRKDGVKIDADGFIEGPDRVRIELAEDKP